MAIQFMEKNIQSPLKLNSIADASFLSPFHFHRIFQSSTGITPREYLEKIRLSSGAHLLRSTLMPIGDIAYQVGFENHETFSRKFKRRFQISPEKFRKKTPILQWTQSRPISTKLHSKIQTQIGQLQLRERKETLQLITYRNIGAYKKLPQAWQKFTKEIAKYIVLDKTDRFIGIWYDNPEITEEDSLRFDTCFAIHDGISFHKQSSSFLHLLNKLHSNEKDMNPNLIPNNEEFISIIIKSQGFHQSKLEPGRFIVFEYKGRYENLDIVYPILYKTIFQKGNFVLGNRPSYEVYIQSPLFYKPKNYLTEIWIPID